MQTIQQSLRYPINQPLRPANNLQREDERKKLEQESKNLDSKLMSYFGNEFYERKLEITPKRNPLENFIVNEDFEKLTPNVKIYKYLRGIEKEIDDKIYKTRLEIQEQIIKPKNKVKALIRTQIYALKNKIEDMEKFVMRIQGRIIDNFPENINTKKNSYYNKFTYYFSKIKIKFENNVYQEIEWNNNYNKMLNIIEDNQEENYNKNLEGFMITRPFIEGMKNLKVEIEFYLNYPNPELTLSPQLSHILGINQGTRPTILYHLWQYIKLNSLQDNENPNIIINDKYLQYIFKCEKISITNLIGRLSEHLNIPEPIKIEFDIKNLSYNYKDNVILRDIIVPIEDPYNNSIFSFLTNSEEESLLFPKHLYPNSLNQNKVDKYLNQINEIDKNMNTMINILNKHKYRYDYYEAYAKDPIKFINNFIIQQNELIKIVDENSLVESRNDYFSSQYCKDYEEVIREYVDKYLNNLNLLQQQSQNPNQNQ